MAIHVKPETALRGTRAIVQAKTLLRHNVLNPFTAGLSSGSSRGPYPLRRKFDSSSRNHFNARVTQLVECHLAMVDVDGSNPFSRSSNSPLRFSWGHVHPLSFTDRRGLPFMRRWPSGWVLAFQASQTGPTPVRRSIYGDSFNGKTGDSKSSVVGSSPAPRAFQNEESMIARVR